MGYVFNYKDAINYEKLLLDPSNRFVIDIQNQLMMDMMKPFKGQSLLSVGCGTGMTLLPLVDLGLQISGIDPSPYMLDIAKKHLGHKIDLHRGFGEDLPFEDNSFNYVCLFSSLEYVENPRKTIAEASRVAKDQICLTAMNRYAITRIPSTIKGVSIDSIFNEARYFSVWELTRIARMVSGNVPLFWKTASRLPRNNGKIARSMAQSKLRTWYPFGSYIGIVVTLIPRFRTRPLTIAYSTEP